VQVADPVVGAERRDVVVKLTGRMRRVGKTKAPWPVTAATAAATAATGTTVAVGEVIWSTTTSRVRGEQAAAYADTIASSAAPTGKAASTSRAPARAA
jgi:hypothetical protein